MCVRERERQMSVGACMCVRERERQMSVGACMCVRVFVSVFLREFVCVRERNSECV